jgi:hypothetical protein
MSHIAWQVYIVLVLLVIAIGMLTFMLIYRARHKTNIETTLLLKQMRITSRMRGALDVQKNYLDVLDGYHQSLLEDWESIRLGVRASGGADIGEMRMPPEPETDLNRLLSSFNGG